MGLKIVHVLTSLLRGGAEENTLLTCRQQLDMGHEVYLLHGSAIDPKMRAQVPPGAKVIFVPQLLREIRPVQDTAAVSAIARQLRYVEPDVVHTHQSKAGFVGRMAAHHAHVPVILHGVHILPFLNVSPLRAKLLLAMERHVARYTDAFIAVARGMHDANLSAGLGTKENNHIVYSGMEIERFLDAAPTTEAPAGRIITFVASLERRKRHWEFFGIFARLKNRWPDLQLCLLGQGDMAPSLRARAAALGIADQVHFLGFRDDVAPWIAASEICVLPSKREGLPRAVVQYVAAGRPVVVSRLPGIEEIVTDGSNGFLADLEDLSGMEAAIHRLLAEPALAASMQAASRAKNLSQWSAARMAEDIETIMARLVRHKERLPAPAAQAAASTAA
ncbi:MAG: glycosyltransferase [Pseudomonadota bacterium]